MTLIEFIGFVISLAAMIFLVVKRFWDENQRRRNPEKYAEKQSQKEKLLSDLMKSFDVSRKEISENEPDEDDEDMNGEVEEVRRHPIKKPMPPQRILPLRHSTRQSLDKMHLTTSFNDHYGESTNEKRFLKSSMSDSYEEEIVSSKFLKGEASAYDLDKQLKPRSRASKILSGLPSPKNMLIIKEVFGLPKSMRNDPWD